VLYFALEIVGTGVKREKEEGRTDEWWKDRGKKEGWKGRR